MKKILQIITVPLIVGVFAEIVFLLFQAKGIYGGDSGDLVTAAVEFGVPHPPGYPLYTFIAGLLSRLPIFTPAWRVALVSSIPHAVVVGLVYLLIVRLTKRPIIALFTAMSLLGNYVFFLYSVTPEVFGLFDLFIAALLYLLITWQQTKQVRYVCIASFLFGLSLTHHQLILFFVPAIGWWMWTNRALWLSKKFSLRSNNMRMGFFFAIGLLLFLYIPIAARGKAIINWDRPVDLTGFIHLVTRADYGTFVSGGFYGSHLIERFLQVQGYAQLFFVDFRVIGLLLVLFGCFFLWRTQKSLLGFLLLGIFFLGPGFFFYASFPILNRFNWGTYERFLLPSYILFYLFMGLGMYQLVLWIEQGVKKSSLRRIATYGAIGVLFIYPILMFGITLWRFIGIPTDETANNLGRDVLVSLPKNAIVLLSHDTPLFITQYVRYVLGVRPDVFVLHTNKMPLADYPTVLRNRFPQLSIPNETGPTFAAAFIQKNFTTHEIFANTTLPVEKGWFWVPYGLLYRLTSENDLPQMDAFYKKNRAIWDTFHDPGAGILSRYNHLMLSDVRDVYASARIEFGKTMLKANKLTEAKTELLAGLAYGGDTQVSDAYILLGLTELFGKQCDAAIADFGKAKSASLGPNKFIALYEAATYRDCVGDASAAARLFSEYERAKKTEETPLQ